MLTEIIAIGDELISGERLDTNSQWLSRELSRIGAEVHWHSSVGDDLPAIAAVIRIAVARADCIIVTGGLGPTADDLTRQAIADAAGVALQLDERQLERIEGLFRRRGREMPLRNRVQAELPHGAAAIDNPHGSAPGIDLIIKHNDERSSRLFALPGVPAEMEEMFQSAVEPAIRTMLGANARTIAHYCLKCFGKGESDLEAMLPDLIRRGRDPQVGITVHEATITLRITAAGRDLTECRDKMVPTIELIHASLDTLVFGENDDELQHAVVRHLKRTGSTLAVIEAGSGGMLSQWLHEADPAGEVFRGGLVIRDTRSLPRIGLPAVSFENALSQQRLAAEMARYARSFFNTDFSLALTSFPTEVDSSAEPQYVGAAVDRDWKPISQALHFAGHPEVRGPRAAKQALDMLRLHLPVACSE